jgi:hypothetical protein
VRICRLARIMVVESLKVSRRLEDLVRLPDSSRGASYRGEMTGSFKVATIVYGAGGRSSRVLLCDVSLSGIFVFKLREPGG